MGAVGSIIRLSNPSAQCLVASLDAILSYTNVHSLAISNSKWVNDGLKDIVKLLDMCNTVSDSIADVKHYHMLLQIAIHSVDHAGMDINKMNRIPLVRATNRLAERKRAIMNANAKCNTTISRLRVKVIASRLSRSDGDLRKDMGNLNDYTASVLKTVANSLVLELPRKFFHGQSDPRVFAPRSSHLCSLFERARNRNKCKGSRFLLHELERTDTLVKQLYDLLADKQHKARNEPSKVKELVDTLKQCMRDLDEGMAALDNKIKELYKALIRIRVTLLDILTYSL